MTELLNYKLRPHHSLCIQYFEGKGYSSTFVKEMQRIIVWLEQNNPVLTLTEDCDMVCGSCPNKKSGRCITHCKVNEFDTACLKEYRLSFDSAVSWERLKQLALDKIINKGLLSEVCSGCQWKCWEQEKLSLTGQG